METLILHDLSQVKKEDTAYCRKLQAAISASVKAGSGDIVVPKEWFPNWNKRIGKLQLFTTFNESCWTTSFVGFLQYKGRIVIIRSRFEDPERNAGELFQFMLEKVLLIPRLLWNKDTGMGVGSFRALLPYLFLRQLQEAYGVGAYRQYQSRPYNDSRPKGHIDIPRHIRLNPMMENGRVAYSTREYTADNPINHLILAAWQTIREDPELREITEKLLKSKPEFYQPLKELSLELGVGNLNAAQKRQLLQQTNRPIVHQVYRRYEAVRRTAVLILRHLGFNQPVEDHHTVTGMLFPMDLMWELLLEKTVFAQVQRRKIIRHISTQEKIPILMPLPKADPLSAKRTIKPDFMLDYDKVHCTAAAVMDAKYKEIWAEAYYSLDDRTDTAAEDDEETDDGGNPSDKSKKTPWRDNRIREDSFQLLSYMLITRAPFGGILFPTRSEAGPLPIRSICPYPGAQQILCLVPVTLPSRWSTLEEYHKLAEHFLVSCGNVIADMLASSMNAPVSAPAGPAGRVAEG